MKKISEKKKKSQKEKFKGKKKTILLKYHYRVLNVTMLLHDFWLLYNCAIDEYGVPTRFRMCISLLFMMVIFSKLGKVMGFFKRNIYFDFWFF